MIEMKATKKNCFVCEIVSQQKEDKKNNSAGVHAGGNQGVERHRQLVACRVRWSNFSHYLVTPEPDGCF